jgi:hypothetical protein
LIVYRDGETHAAIAARRALNSAIAALGCTADIVLLSRQEQEATGFGHAERASSLAQQCAQQCQLSSSS